jgi:hypothetical protein
MGPVFLVRLAQLREFFFKIVFILNQFLENNMWNQKVQNKHRRLAWDD